MATDHSRKEDEEEINLAPMLDIVFIMLIFFIVTSTFVKETGADIIKPLAVTSEREPQASILVAVDKDGEIWVDGRPVELGAVRGVLQKLFSENSKGTMSIQADKDSPARLIVDLIDEGRSIGIENIIVSTDEP